ncbi:transcription factor A, mitochondrial isoform X2 [Eurosta solidaginis]|uniref:transcription factor A, mitochondrial isoform X2 n=2 Tax=Eurosta solidaginis TaxID=178769 RepID=UPI0035307E4D
MLLTVPLLSKASLFGSLINKCRQAGIASLSVTTREASSTVRTTLEEKVGLPPRPKKPLTPFFRFMREQREKTKANNPHFSTREIVREMSQRWSEADEVTRNRLQDEFKRELQNFVEAKAKYEATMTDTQRAELKLLKDEIQEAKERRMMRKRIIMLGRPKRPASAFLRFLVQERTNAPQTANQTYREWQAKCAEKWSRLSDKEKQPFLEETRREITVYKKDIAEWEESMVRLGNIDVVRPSNLIDPPEPKSKGIKPNV